MNKAQIEQQARELLPAVLKAIANKEPIVAANALYMALQLVDFTENGHRAKKEAK